MASVTRDVSYLLWLQYGFEFPAITFGCSLVTQFDTLITLYSFHSHHKDANVRMSRHFWPCIIFYQFNSILFLAWHALKVHCFLMAQVVFDSQSLTRKNRQ
jgi:hypothetical protein